MLSELDIKILEIAADSSDTVLAPIAALVASKVDPANPAFPDALKGLCLLSVNLTQVFFTAYTSALAGGEDGAVGGKPDGTPFWQFPSVEVKGGQIVPAPAPAPAAPGQPPTTTPAPVAAGNFLGSVLSGLKPTP